MTESSALLNSIDLDPHYPRPQLRRSNWLSLDGSWKFKQDPQNIGIQEGWFTALPTEQDIIVPFPPESAASGVHDTSFDNRIVWYEQTLNTSDLRKLQSNSDDLIKVHFGAIDYESEVWVNGHSVKQHLGGNTPFSIDLTQFLSAETVVITVRAQDDPLDTEKPRGKQDWLPQPHVIWYERTSGIWQSVWAEAVPFTYISKLHTVANLPDASVRVDFELNQYAPKGSHLEVTLTYEDEILAQGTVLTHTTSGSMTLEIPRQRNGQHYERLLWSPEHPRLIKVAVSLGSDLVHSYLGLRSVAYDHGKFLLNDRPYYMRSVLNQGYRPQSHLAALSVDSMREEIQLIKDLGFNAARLHQKVEDPRLAFFADVLGLMLWVEAPSAYTTSNRAITRMIAEWPAIVDRFKSHPSVVAWVPINESWGVQHIAHDNAAQHFTQALWHLTKTLDPTRLVVSNDGWEMTDSDIWSVHDYEGSPEVMAERYGSPDSTTEILNGLGPAGRRMRLTDEPDRGQPVMLTEFGGITYAPNSTHDTWGYSTSANPEQFENHLRELVSAVRKGKLAGYCYTQLRDTLQEANGLVDEAGAPKLPLATYREIFGGPL